MQGRGWDKSFSSSYNTASHVIVFKERFSFDLNKVWRVEIR